MGLNIKRLASNLTRLEVNTILREGLHASSPKSNRHMFYQLAKEYREKLLQLDADLHRFNLSEGDLAFEWNFAGERSFKEINTLAKKQLRQYEHGIETLKSKDTLAQLKSELRSVERICLQSEAVLDVFRELKSNEDEEQWNNDISVDTMNEIEDIEMNPRQLAVVRKAHEIGTQQILMQTVVQIDGDITTYITPKYMSFELKEQNMLLDVHNNAFSTSMKVWKYLFETLGSLAGKVLAPGKDPQKKKLNA